MKVLQNYRGVRPAQLVGVLEGEGNEENPYYVAEYVIAFEEHKGVVRPVTIGKVVPLTPEETKFLGK